MARRKTSVLEERFEQVQTRFRKAGKELEKLQKRADKNRRDFESRARKRADKAQKQLLEIPAIKAADDFRIDMRKQIETTVDDLLSRMPIASNSDIKKLERKVNALTRKVRALEKAEAS
ncbi:MAG: hypothetical protein GY944_10340 [bacterium]|nr:hypothetical protein [bacterium]MCP5041413.1 hypothetical protein [bacterium]